MRSGIASCSWARPAIIPRCSISFWPELSQKADAAMQVTGRIVVVTGGANGIGRALCEAFHRAGAAKVVVADLDLKGAEAVAASIDGAAFKCDVGQEQDIVHVIDETERQFGPVALFCSNAGIGGGFD